MPTAAPNSENRPPPKTRVSKAEPRLLKESKAESKATSRPVNFVRRKTDGASQLWEHTEETVARSVVKHQALLAHERLHIPPEFSNPVTPIIIFDSSGRLHALNDVAKSVLKTRKIDPDANLSTWIDPDDVPLFLRHLRLCRDLPPSPVATYMRLNVHGLVLSVQLVSVCVASESGSHFRTAILSRSPLGGDSAQIAEKILSLLDVPVALAKSNGDVAWVNAAFLRLFHINPQYAAGLSVKEILQFPTAGILLEERFARVLGGTRYVESVLLDCHKTREGATVTVMLTIRRLSINDEEHPLLLLQFQNVTARIKAEADRENVLHELQELTDALENKVTERTTELQVAHEHLRTASTALVEIQERERRHLACELHDEIGQNLTGLKLMLDELLRSSPPERRGILTEAHGAAAIALEQVRNLSLRLRPQVLDDLGLVVAIKWLVDQFRRRLPRTRINLDMPGNINQPPASNAAITLYRVAQEALNNVAKHSEAKMVRVKVTARADDLLLVIADNGKGFDPDTVRQEATTGLSSMAERVNLLGGEFQVHSRPGKGATIRCSIPKDSIKK